MLRGRITRIIFRFKPKPFIYTRDTENDTKMPDDLSWIKKLSLFEINPVKYTQIRYERWLVWSQLGSWLKDEEWEFQFLLWTERLGHGESGPAKKFMSYWVLALIRIHCLNEHYFNKTTYVYELCEWVLWFGANTDTLSLFFNIISFLVAVLRANNIICFFSTSLSFFALIYC